MMFNAILVSLVLVLPANLSMAQIKDTDMVLVITTNAKLAGMCGTIRQMTAFQGTTQMPGGNDFLVRFIKTEAARLGMGLQDFLSQCVTISQQHAEYMRLLSGE